MFTVIRQLWRRASAFMREHLIALVGIVLFAAIVLGGNLCGWARYSVEEDGYVTAYGMPFPYKILRCEVVFPGWPPQQSPPLLPFDFSAMLWDTVIGLVLLSVAAVLLFRQWRLPPLPHQVIIPILLITMITLICLAGWGILASTARHNRQQDILAKFKASDVYVYIDYPVPDVVWLAMRRIGLLWSSPEQTDNFLDASMGTVVFVQGSPTILSYVAKLPALRALDVKDDPESAEHYIPARLLSEKTPRLERISVELGRITNLQDVIELPRLRFLTIRGNPDPDSLRAVNRLTNLELLDLTECLIPEGEIIEFDKLTKLRILASGELQDTALRSIGKLPHLEELYLSGLTDNSIVALQDARSLRKLHLDGCWAIGDDATKVLKGLTGLRYLKISGSSITDAGVGNLAALPELDELVLTGNHITSEGVSALAKLPRLRKLDISGTAVDDHVGVALHDMKGLESLNLGGTKITDEVVADLRGLKNLRSVNLSNTKVTDRCIAYLLDITSLREVHLNMTAVTVEGAARLQILPALQALKIYDCPAIPLSTLTILQKQMPNLAIVEPAHSSLAPAPVLANSKVSAPDIENAPKRKEE